MKISLAHGVARNSGIFAHSGKGIWVYTTSGQKLLDMTSGIGALSTGHTHPTVIHRVSKQLRKIVHAQQNCVYSHLPQMELNERISGITPSHLNQIFYTNSGSEAVENSIKVARRATGKTNVISFLGGFHGRTTGCMSISSSKISCRQGFQPLLSGVFQLQYPFHRNHPDYDPRWPHRLDELFKRATAPDETAAIIIEPVLGEGGVVGADKEHIQHLRKVCREYNIRYISDEVQTGMGRTGEWWGFQHYKIQPDMITFGKAIASGFPLAGLLGSSDDFETLQENGLGGTYNGNALACEAANATFDVYDEENLPVQVAQKGMYLANKIQSIRHRRVNLVRHYGLMIGIELDVPHQLTFQEWIKTAPEYGIMVLTTGIDTTVRLLPPLTITTQEIDEFCLRFEKWLNQKK